MEVARKLWDVSVQTGIPNSLDIFSVRGSGELSRWKPPKLRVRRWKFRIDSRKFPAIFMQHGALDAEKLDRMQN